MPGGWRGVMAFALLGSVVGPVTAAQAGHGSDVMALDADYVSAQYAKGRKLTAIDLRSPDEYRRGHLPGRARYPSSS